MHTWIINDGFSLKGTWRSRSSPSRPSSLQRNGAVLQVAGAMLDEGFMAEARAETMKQEREEVCVAMQYAASFHCLVEEWKDCEELKPKPKEKWLFVRKKRVRRRSIEWSGVRKQTGIDV